MLEKSITYKQSFRPHDVVDYSMGGHSMVSYNKIFSAHSLEAVQLSSINSLKRQLLSLQKVGKFGNESKFPPVEVFSNSQKLGEMFAPTVKVLVIRGIGYRAYVVYNELVYNVPTPSEDVGVEDEDQTLLSNNSWPRYIFVRVGQSYPTYMPLWQGLGVRKKRRGRKLVLYGFNRHAVTAMRDLIYSFKKPDIFTGRGIRLKGHKYRRKLGKRASRI